MLKYIDNSGSKVDNKRRLALDFAWFEINTEFISKNTPTYPLPVVKSLIFAANSELKRYKNATNN